ncbi:MAG: D-alanine--D-alanine ligase [Lachnospiraceae bacterium]|nr:D-alanine--D-alanine ligase [Lachnospiraceae bacterium]
MKIVVLCGGLSTERKISFSTGTRVCGALREAGHQAVLVDLFLGLEDLDTKYRKKPELLFDELLPLEEVVFDGREPDLDAVRASRKLKSDSLFGEGVIEICRAADVVFIGLHGLNGEDGRIQAAFDMLGIAYTGSGYLGAAMTMDKMITKQMLRPLGVPTPDWKYYTNVTEDEISGIIAKTSLPCVVKTPTGGSSVGVVIVRETGELEPAIRQCLTYSRNLLIEEYIPGREFTCGVLMDRALPSVEIAPKVRFYDYSSKYQPGATEEICPGRCSEAVENRMHDIALFVHRKMGLSTYSRSDFIVDDNDNVYFLEVNTLPGMTPTSLVPQEAAAAGISYRELCVMIVEDALRLRGKA